MQDEGKQALRRRMLDTRLNLDSMTQREWNQSIHRRLSEIWKPSWKNILCYLSQSDEVDTLSLIKDWLGDPNITLSVPAWDAIAKNYIPSQIVDIEKDVEPGRYGILEPRASMLRPQNRETLDVIIVPGLAFDLKGNRLGYGFGYFDSLCQGIRATKIGLAYGFQILENIPTHGGDIPMDWILTENNTHSCRTS